MRASYSLSQWARRLSRPAKELVWVALGQTLAFAGALVGVKILTNVLSPEAYGQLGLGMSVAGIINIMVFGPVSQVVLRFYSICRESNTLSIYFHTFQQLHLRLVPVLLVLCLPLALAVQLAFGSPWGVLVAVAIIFGTLSGLYGSLQSLVNAMRKRQWAAGFQAADSWFRVLMALALIISVGSVGWIALLGYIVGTILVLVAQLVWARATIASTLSGETAPELTEQAIRNDFMAYGMPFVYFAGIAVIGQYADRWLLQGFWGERQVGIYTAIFQLASAPVALFMAIVNQAVIPVVFAKAGGLTDEVGVQHSHRLVSLTIVMLIAFFAVITFASFFWGEVVVGWFTNADYAAHGNIFWIIVLALAFFNLAQLSSIRGYFQNQTNIYFWPKIGQGVVLLCVGVFLVQRYATYGMAATLLISYVAYFILVKLVHWKYLNAGVYVQS